MSRFVDLAKKIPGVRRLHQALNSRYVAYRMRRNPTEYVFTDIFERRLWGAGDSVSGPGSNRAETRAIAEALPALISELDVDRLLDLPCGDFHWMSAVERQGWSYIGGDIVKPLIEGNRARYSAPDVEFQHLDLLKSELPQADLILCRDCLVHFSFADLSLALTRLMESRATYLLTTHFPGCEQNVDISTGEWRALNFEIAPFEFPAPLRVLSEECRLEDGAHEDKVLALWRIEDLARVDAKWRTWASCASSS